MRLCLIRRYLRSFLCCEERGCAGVLADQVSGVFPCCFSWGSLLRQLPPLAVVETVTARVSVLPDVGSELPTVSDVAAVVCAAPVYEVGNGALDEVGLNVGQSCFRMDSEDTLPPLQDERSVMSFLVQPAAVLISQFFVSYDDCGDDRFSPGMSDRVSLNCHVDLDSFWIVSRDVHRNVETGSRTGVSDWRRILRCVARMSCLPEFPVNNGLKCLDDLWRNYIMDLSACGTLSPSDSVAVGPGGPDGPLSSSDLAGVLVPAVPAGIPFPVGPAVHVGLDGTLSPSNYVFGVLVDHGGTLPSPDHAGMLLPAVPAGILFSVGPVGPVSLRGTLSLSSSDPAGPDGLYFTGGPVGPIGTLSPSDSGSAILVDPGGTLSSPDPAVPAGILLPVGFVGPFGPCGTLSPFAFESAILVDPGGVFPSFDLGQ